MSVRVPLHPTRSTQTVSHGPSRFWTATDKDVESKSTHLWLINQATRAILNALGAKDGRAKKLTDIVGPNDAPKKNNHVDRLRQALWDADALSPYADQIFASHFYNPVTGKNWKGNTTFTALTETLLYYWQSIIRYAVADVEGAAYSLGLALHYLTDLTQPMHTALFTNASWPFGFHELFEDVAISAMNDSEMVVDDWTPVTKSPDPTAHVRHTALDSRALFDQADPNMFEITNPIPGVLTFMVRTRPVMRAALRAGVPNVADFLWLWICQASSVLWWGQRGDIPLMIRGEKAKPANLGLIRVVPTGEATWYVRNSLTDAGERHFSLMTRDPRQHFAYFSGKFAGAGEDATFAVFDTQTALWDFYDSKGRATYRLQGVPGIPVVGRFLRRDSDHVGVVKDGRWTIHDDLQTKAPRQITKDFGMAGDLPVPGNYVGGEGLDELAVWRPSTGRWYVRREGAKNLEITWGEPNDIPVPASYHGGGKLVPATFRPSTGTWWVSKGFDNEYEVETIGLGQEGDVPMPGDYRGSGKARPAVWRPVPGVWIVEPDLTPTDALSAS